MRVGQANFAKGEISEELVSRIDVPAYATALRRANNVTILKYGGVTKRPGTRLVSEVYDGTGDVRLVPFQFSLTQTYVIEMGQAYARFAANGGLVVEEQITITAITLGATTTIAAEFHAFDVGDQVYFSGVEGTTEINGKIGRVLSVIDDSHFVVDINSTGFSAFTGDAGGITRTATPPPPPPPPPVPPPAPDPMPPDTGGGGGGFDGFHCVTADTLILMADGSLRRADCVKVGDKVHTQHETTLEWGDYEVLYRLLVRAPVWSVEVDGHTVRASAGHRLWIDGTWVTIETIGVEDGETTVVELSVDGARTYISNGILSHNVKTGDYL